MSPVRLKLFVLGDTAALRGPLVAVWSHVRLRAIMSRARSLAPKLALDGAPRVSIVCDVNGMTATKLCH